MNPEDGGISYEDLTGQSQAQRRPSAQFRSNMKQYYYVKHDEHKVVFDTSSQLLQFLQDNTSEDEAAEAGVINLTDEEYAETLRNNPEDYDL